MAGVTKFTAPYTTNGQSANYLINLGGTYDLSAATIASQLYVQTQGSAAQFQYLLQFTYTPPCGGGGAGGTSGGGGAGGCGNASMTCTAFVNWTNIGAPYTTGFSTYSLNVGTLGATTGYCSSGTAPLDKTKITSIGIQLNGATSGPYTTSTVWADSLTVTGASPNIAAYSFDTSTPFAVGSIGGGLSNTATVTWQATYP